MTRRQFALTLTGGYSTILRTQDTYHLKIGIQSYTLRHLPFNRAIETIRKLGVRYFETFGWPSGKGHLPTDTPPQRLEEIKSQLKEMDLQLMAYGVIGIDKGTPEQTLSLFNLAKIMEVYSISADPEPEPEVWDLLGKFTEETGIKIAIHPHGPEYTRYPGWKAIYKTIFPLRLYDVGFCMDVGHVVRNGEDPIEGILEMKDRIYGVHLKDIDKQHRDVVIGTGIIDIGGILRTLGSINYQGVVSIEYEQPDGVDPMPGLVQSLKYVRSITE